MICPKCKGSGQGGAGFVSRTSGCGVEVLPCHACGGRGEVASGYDARCREGERFGDARRAAGLGLREFAKRVGASAKDVSDVEFGRADVPAAWWAALEVTP